jgi:hypothetical protein
VYISPLKVSKNCLAAEERYRSFTYMAAICVSNAALLIFLYFKLELPTSFVADSGTIAMPIPDSAQSRVDLASSALHIILGSKPYF